MSREIKISKSEKPIDHDPVIIGDYPAGIEVIPSIIKIDSKGTNLDGIKKTIDDMVDNNHPLIEHLEEHAEEAIAYSDGPAGQMIRWAKKHKKGIIMASEVAAVVGVTATVITLDVLYHVRQRRIKNANGKNTDNSH